MSAADRTERGETGSLAPPGYRTKLLRAVDGARDLIEVVEDDPEARFALSAYYVRGKAWKEVAALMGRSERSVYEARARGLAAIRRELERTSGQDD
jgi:DNA-directed RNA polymerase specialized sigma24 family protein